MRFTVLLGLTPLVGCYDPIYGRAIGESGLDCSAIVESYADVSGTVTDPVSSDVQAIWDQSCSGSACHTDGGQAGGLALDDSYEATVGQGDVGGLAYVEAGDPCASYLWHKLAGTQLDAGGAGGQMPQGGELSEEDMATVTHWIENGAPQ